MVDRTSIEKSEDSTVHNDLPVSSIHATNVLNADLGHALSTGSQLKPWSTSAFKLYIILSVAFMGSLSYGFDNSVMGSVNGLSQYTDYFHIGGSATGGGQGIAVAMLLNIFSLGGLVGSLVSAPAADRWGRRMGMILAGIVILVGVSLVTAAQNRVYLFFGRFLIGFGSAVNNSAAPPYVAELSPPQWRGHLAGLYNTFNFIGAIICSALIIGTGSMNSSAAWRLPFALQFVPTIILLAGAYFIPESPRWLMSVGRKDEARAILAKYHGDGDTNAPLVVLEYEEIEACVKNATNTRWVQLFDSRSSRYRTLISCWLGLCYIFSGFSIFNYSTVAFDLTGVKTQTERLIFSFVSSTAGGLGSVTGAAIADRVGRRPSWLWGTLGCSITLALTAAFTAAGISPAATTFLVMFSFVMNGTYMPLLGMYPSECLSYETRAKGFALIAFIESLTALVGNFAGSVAFQKIGWKYFLVFAIWNAIETITIWYCAVETKGRTLEELNEIFEDQNPVKASLRRTGGG